MTVAQTYHASQWAFRSGSLSLCSDLPQLWGELDNFQRKGGRLKNFRKFVMVILCLLVANCGGRTSTPVEVNQVTIEPSAPRVEPSITEPTLPTEELISTVVRVDSVTPPADDSPPLEQPDAWQLLVETLDDPDHRNPQLLKAAIDLVAKRRSSEAESLLELIDVELLSEVERVERRMLAVRLAQEKNQHRLALRQLARLQRSAALDFEQRVRIGRLKAYSYSMLGRSIDLANELAQLYSLLSAERNLQLAVGHQLWATLSRMTMDDLRRALQEQKDPIARQWYVLALALGLDSVRADPYRYSSALAHWQRENPEHPANELIQAGLAPALNRHSKLVLLLPLTSTSGTYVQALLDGFMAQYEADTNPLKPQVDVIDVGNQPTDATLFYYQAVNQGADFIIGPLGVSYVDEMVQYVDFIVPTLLLGEVAGAELPNSVFQFALAPEHEGVAIARRALQDGHITTVVIKSSQPWSMRAFSAFREEWERRGGQLLQIDDYELDQDDYSDTAKRVMLVNSSAERYQSVRAMTGEKIKFVPRRRQDVDFIFLAADAEHARLLKPYLDFVKAHDLPIYATSHVFSGEVNKIRDQDLSGIRFADMDWIIERSQKMADLRATLEGEKSPGWPRARLFAMGVDIYGLVARINTLSTDQTARFHGVTSILRMTEDGQIRRAMQWAMFNDGVPELIPGIPPPEPLGMPYFSLVNQPVPIGVRPE